MKLFFIRHGQTDWNIEGKIQGSRNIQLNDTGIKQAEELITKVLEEKYKFSREPERILLIKGAKDALLNSASLFKIGIFEIVVGVIANSAWKSLSTIKTLASALIWNLAIFTSARKLIFKAPLLSKLVIFSVARLLIVLFR